jgi:hypothetical protein
LATSSSVVLSGVASNGSSALDCFSPITLCAASDSDPRIGTIRLNIRNCCRTNACAWPAGSSAISPGMRVASAAAASAKSESASDSPLSRGAITSSRKAGRLTPNTIATEGRIRPG